MASLGGHMQCSRDTQLMDTQLSSGLRNLNLEVQEGPALQTRFLLGEISLKILLEEMWTLAELP